jgi:hypothetical protein
LFTVYRASDQDYLVVNSYWEPEVSDGGRVFRWVSDRRSGGFKINWVAPQSAYMYFCVESGPSIDFSSFDLIVRTPSGKNIREFRVDPSGCFWLPKKDFYEGGSVLVSSSAVGRIISPLEGRKLNFQIFNFGISSSSGEPSGLVSRGLVRDVELSQLHLGNGWYGPEMDGDQIFRWAGNSARIQAAGAGNILILDVAPGPSLPPGTELALLTADGKVVQKKSLPLTRGRLSFDLTEVAPFLVPFREFELKPIVLGHAVEADPRILNYRVFSLVLK